MIERKRWLYLGAGTLTLLFLGLIYAWSIFRAPFADMFPSWTVSQLSLTFTISMTFFCLGGFAGGILSRKLNVRTRYLVSALLLFAGFFGVSVVKESNPGTSLILLYLFYGVLGGSGVGVAYNTTIGTVNKWFPEKVGLASGIMLMGFGLGGLVLGSAVNHMISGMGLKQTFVILGIAIAAVCVAAAFIIKEVSIDQSGETVIDTAASEEDSSDDYTPVEMIRSSKFWLIIVWLILLSSGGLLVINSAANIAIAFGGTATLGMIVSLFNGAGRIIAGSNFDRKGRRFATLVNNAFMIIAGVLLSLGAFTNNLLLIMLGLIFVGLSYGGCPTITSAYINQTFGSKYFSANFSLANFNLIAGAMIGPMVSSVLLESAGGEYTTNFFAVIAFAVAAIVVWFILNIVSKSSEKPES